jgi:hypothetical protein
VEHLYFRDVKAESLILDDKTHMPFRPISLEFYPEAVRDLRRPTQDVEAQMYEQIGRQFMQAVAYAHSKRRIDDL